MKKWLFFLLLECLLLNVYSQCYISYTYDNSGNRISRVYVGSCAKIGNVVFDESLSGADNELLSSSDNAIDDNKVLFKMYPNPSTNEIFLESKNINDKLVYKIIRSDGAQIVSNRLESEIITIDISNLSAGHYILLVYDQNNILKYKNYILKQ